MSEAQARIGLGDISSNRTLETTRLIEANSVGRLHERYLQGDTISPGQKAKILHLLPNDEQSTIQVEIAQAGSEFWANWSRFRCGVTDEGEAIPPDEPNFYHVVGLLPVVQQFAEFAVNGVDRSQPVIIVDLMGGTGNMAPKIAKRRQIDNYILIDGNPRVEKVAKQNLKNLGVANSTVIIHDLSEGLPDQVGEAVSRIKKKDGQSPHVIFVSNWGLTYLPLEPMMRVIEQCFDSSATSGLPATLAFNMITDGRFDPEIMNRRFGREVVPRQLLTCQVNALKRAGAARPYIVQFGKELPSAAPIWYPKEIIDPLKQAGFNVTDVNSSFLWEQCTGVKVSGKV